MTTGEKWPVAPTREITAEWVAGRLSEPGPSDNKYTRGVVLMATGSPTYLGAAVLGCLGAARSGAGFVRYLGPQRCEDLILTRIPEAVMGGGRMDSAVLGSGWDSSMASIADLVATESARIGLPLVVDAGALAGAAEWAEMGAQVIVTPHLSEAAKMLKRLDRKNDVTAEEIQEHQVHYAELLASRLGVLIALKGATTVVAGPGLPSYSFTAEAGWGGTAGAGDVLAGAIGTFVAQAHATVGEDQNRPGERHAEAAAGGKPSTARRTTTDVHSSADTDRLLKSVAAAVGVHGFAAGIACGVLDRDLRPTGRRGNPILASDIADSIPAVINALLG